MDRLQPPPAAVLAAWMERRDLDRSGLDAVILEIRLRAARRVAEMAWDQNPGVRDAARLFGFDREAYITRHIEAHWKPMFFTSTGAN